MNIFLKYHFYHYNFFPFCNYCNMATVYLIEEAQFIHVRIGVCPLTDLTPTSNPNLLSWQFRWKWMNELEFAVAHSFRFTTLNVLINCRIVANLHLPWMFSGVSGFANGAAFTRLYRKILYFLRCFKKTIK